MAGVEPLNGIGLCRTTAFAYDPEAGTLAPIRSGSEDKAVYTPDIVVSVSDGESKRWFVADAKYSTVRTAATDQAMPLVFKYLFSISTLDKGDQQAGLWLLCGKEGGKTAFPESLNAYGGQHGAALGPDVHFERLLGLDGEEKAIGLVEAIAAQ